MHAVESGPLSGRAAGLLIERCSWAEYLVSRFSGIPPIVVLRQQARAMTRGWPPQEVMGLADTTESGGSRPESTARSSGTSPRCAGFESDARRLQIATAHRDLVGLARSQVKPTCRLAEAAAHATPGGDRMRADIDLQVQDGGRAWLEP